MQQASVEVVVQINGKLRAKLQLPAGVQREPAVEAAMADANVQRFIAGKQIRKVIYVPDKLVNLVV
jgi:leucyl-tRNA synthetase